MDGYIANRGGKCRIKGKILAGDSVERVEVKEGECFYIATGAPVPSGGRFIAIWEQVEVEGEWAKIPDLPPGANIRPEGEEFHQGDTLLKPGEEVTPEAVLALAGQGIDWIEVYKPVSVAVIPTGNELAEPYEEAGRYQLYNSNGYGVAALLRQFSFKTTLLPPLSDRLEEIEKRVEEAVERFDAVITIGGASKGKADHLQQVLERVGVEWVFRGLNLKPGKPTLLGLVNGKPVISLPGNLLSSYLNAYLVALPLLRRLGGSCRPLPSHLQLEVGESFKANPKKDHIILGRIEGGQFFPYRGYRYGSGMVTPLLHSNSYALLPAGSGGGRVGEPIVVIPFRGPFVPVEESFLTLFS
jgi:molybdopterin molybdotransferase